MSRQLEGVDEYVASLAGCLQWNPSISHDEKDKVAKGNFIEALTEISALASDSLGMELRTRLVQTGTDADGGKHMYHLLNALNHRDVHLKCKAANAIGSICTSRVAGQLLLDTFGEPLITRLTNMAKCKNTWSQADSFSVFGWIVVIADDVMLRSITQLVPLAITSLQNHFTSPSITTEEASNLRIYVLVFLLNFSQRDVSVFAAHLQGLLDVLHKVLLLIIHSLNIHDSQSSSSCVLAPSDFMEILRLSITLLCILVDQIREASTTFLALKMLPTLLKVQHSVSSLALNEQNDCECEGENIYEVIQDIQHRMELIISTVIAHR